MTLEDVKEYRKNAVNILEKNTQYATARAVEQAFSAFVCIEQYRWERDIAISQLNDLGYEFGERIEEDWILCSDRLPEGKYNTTPYWITLHNKDFEIYVTRKAYWNEYDKCWQWENGRKLATYYEVVAWKQYGVPKPYKPDDKQYGLL